MAGQTKDIISGPTHLWKLYEKAVIESETWTAASEQATGITTVMILSFRTDMPGQTVQTQIRLLLEETVQTQIRLLLEAQSDQGLHCLPFSLHHLDSILYGRAT